MAKIRVNKVEAARRQIDAAIRMLFSNEDPVAVHTVAMAALRIVRDLAAKRDDSYMHKVTEAIIKPGMEKKFWRKFQAPANFLKHADRDPDGFLENIDEEANEGSLFMACLYYQDLAHQYTPEMMTLAAWYMALHPEFLNDDAPSQLKQVLSDAGLDVKGRARADQLAIGQQLLEMARLMPRRY
jgi:hypothetical protein